MQSSINSLVNKKPYTLLKEMLASIKAFKAIGKNNKGPYKL
jgi:hypothetical protein